MILKLFFRETRPQFLILSIVLAFLGIAIAWYHGYFHLGYALLATFGLVMAHVSVNTLNDYFDYRSGVDKATQRTPFSGGSGMLPEAKLQPAQVLWLGLGSLLAAALIGIYFTVTVGWQLLPLLLVAVFCIVLYSPFILKLPWPELSAGLGLGILPVLGAYFVQSGTYTWPALVAAVPSGILVHNLLFLNEFPDVEADKIANRKTMPITLNRTRSSRIYAALTILVYVWIVAWVAAGVMPVFTLLGLLTIPMAVKAIKGALRFGNMNYLVPAMASNVMVVLLTQFFLGIGYILAVVF
ncbi:MAG: prenyltransferase [Dehalococcoidales bacterium]|nr:prenyltransferase [Dehalococcoidales bacterium]